jgi:hypothetical protein
MSVDALAGADPLLPTWIERDQAPRIRAWMATAGRRGGFLVIAGDSSVGKSRLLYETAAEELTGWRVLAPRIGEGQAVNELADHADELDGPLVVWLDGLHRFLPGPWLAPSDTPVTSATIARLRNAAAPVVILGSMWPGHIGALLATRRSPDGTAVSAYPAAANVLDSAEIFALDAFNPRELEAAREASANDRRLAVATNDPKFGVTQVLAGAPRLVERYDTATGTERALLLAAIDAQRLGAAPPLTADLLTDASRGYLTHVHPTDDWVQPGLAELTRDDGPHDRATGPLLAITDHDHRRIVGYQVADYLLQHANRARRTAPVPDTTWQALTRYTSRPDDLRRLGQTAVRRGLHHFAIPLFRKAVEAGDNQAAAWLEELLVDQDDLEGRAAAGDDWAALQLTGLLSERYDIEGLRALADAGDHWAPIRLVRLLVDRGDVDGLRALAAGGDRWAAMGLDELLAKQGDLGPLWARATAGHRWAAAQLAQLLVDQRDLNGLRALADTGNDEAAAQLAQLLVDQRDFKGLRELAAATEVP